MAVQHEASCHFPRGSGEFGTRRLVEECDATWRCSTRRHSTTHTGVANSVPCARHATGIASRGFAHPGSPMAEPARLGGSSCSSTYAVFRRMRGRSRRCCLIASRSSSSTVALHEVSASLLAAGADHVPGAAASAPLPGTVAVPGSASLPGTAATPAATPTATPAATPAAAPAATPAATPTATPTATPVHLSALRQRARAGNRSVRPCQRPVSLLHLSVMRIKPKRNHEHSWTVDTAALFTSAVATSTFGCRLRPGSIAPCRRSCPCQRCLTERRPRCRLG